MVTELGALVGTYPTNYRRRGTLAMILLFAGVAVTAPATVLLVVTADRAGKVATAGDPLLLPILLLSFGVAMLLLGVVVGGWALLSRGEVFRVHEFGLVHDRAGTSRTIPWGEVESVFVGPVRNTAVSRFAGGSFHCKVKVIAGRNVLITGLTQNAEELAQHLVAAHQRHAQGS
jgi:hypothetical protein